LRFAVRKCGRAGGSRRERHGKWRARGAWPRPLASVTRYAPVAWEQRREERRLRLCGKVHTKKTTPEDRAHRKRGARAGGGAWGRWSSCDHSPSPPAPRAAGGEFRSGEASRTAQRKRSARMYAPSF
jgi:hypothetical protein